MKNKKILSRIHFLNDIEKNMPASPNIQKEYEIKLYAYDYRDSRDKTRNSRRNYHKMHNYNYATTMSIRFSPK